MKDAIHEAQYRAALEDARNAALKTEAVFYCGFAWVTLRPGTSSFARYCVKKGYARRGCYGGVEFSVYPALDGTKHSHTQAMNVKEEAAEAMAAAFRSYGMKAYAMARAD